MAFARRLSVLSYVCAAAFTALSVRRSKCLPHVYLVLALVGDIKEAENRALPSWSAIWLVMSGFYANHR